MSDTSQGPGWWQASDGKWYPPDQVPAGGPGSGVPVGPGDFSIGEALAYGWNKFVAYIGQIILIVLVIFVVQGVFFAVSRVIGNGSSVGALVLSSVISVVGWVVALAAPGRSDPCRPGHHPGRGAPGVDAVRDRPTSGPYIVASILVGLLFIVGVIACCIGVIVVAIFTLFYGYFVIDKSAQPADSISKSFSLVKEHFGVILGFSIVVFLLNVITCGLAVGVTQISTAYAYKKLTGQPIA